MNTRLSFLFLLISLIVLSLSVSASNSVYSGFVKDGDEFTADGITYKVVSTGEDLNFILQSSLGTVVVYNGTNCEYASRYQYCMDDYKFSLGGKTRLNGKDIEEYSLKINKVYENADLSIAYRTADKTALFVNEVATVKIRVKNNGGATATNIDHKETFPEKAYVASKYPIAYRKLSWSGALAYDEEKDFEYTIYFVDNGTFTVPLAISYFDGVEQKKITNDLVFNVNKEYDVLISGKDSFEIGEVGKLNVTLSGNPKGIIYSEFHLPSKVQFVNTSFERHFGVNSWEGNISNSPKNFTIEFTSDKDVEEESYLLTNYVGSNTKIKTAFPIKFMHEDPIIDYFVKNDKISVYVKNPNKYSAMTDLFITLNGGYSRIIRIPLLNPKEDILVLSEQLTKNVDGPITSEMRYQINGNEYFASTKNSDANMTTNLTLPTISDDKANNQSAIILVNNDSGTGVIADEPAGLVNNPGQEVPEENIENTADGAVAKKDDRGFVEKFFAWLNSIF